MGIGAADCSSPDVMAECFLLMDSVVDFIPHPHENKLQLAISNHINLPLDLTLQSGQCKISCEGSLLEKCNTTKQHYYSQNVISPLYFENCSSHYYYCVIAQIGDCCPVCTDTKYMEDYQAGTFQAPVSSWHFTAAVFVILLILAGLGAVIIFLYTIVSGEKAPKSVRANRIIHVPLKSKQPESTLDPGDVTVLCLYVREENQPFLIGIESLQSFLAKKGFNVVDVHREEDTIDQSVYKWAQPYLRDCSTKIILVDTDCLRCLLDYKDMHRTRKLVEQAIVYIHSCIPINNSFAKLFVVRLQDSAMSEERFFELSNGRCYMYPTHRERLVEDLQS